MQSRGTSEGRLGAAQGLQGWKGGASGSVRKLWAQHTGPQPRFLPSAHCTWVMDGPISNLLPLLALQDSAWHAGRNSLGPGACDCGSWLEGPPGCSRMSPAVSHPVLLITAAGGLGSIPLAWAPGPWLPFLQLGLGTSPRPSRLVACPFTCQEYCRCILTVYMEWQLLAKGNLPLLS